MPKIHYHKTITPEEKTNVFLFPFQCTKSLIISQLLLGVPFLNFIGIPLFLAFAVRAAREETLPDYPPLQELALFTIKTVLVTLISTLPAILFWYFTTNTIILYTVTLLTLYFVLPTRLLTLAKENDLKTALLASLRPALTSTYLIRALVAFAVTTALIYAIYLISNLGTTSAYILLIFTMYYATLFTLSLLANGIE